MKVQILSLWMLSWNNVLTSEVVAFSPTSFPKGSRGIGTVIRVSDNGDAESAETVETENAPATSQKKKKKIAVVGGGWGGWGAAKALCQSKEDIEVTLLDALPDPTGLTPYLSKTGKPGMTHLDEQRT